MKDVKLTVIEIKHFRADQTGQLFPRTTLTLSTPYTKSSIEVTGPTEDIADVKINDILCLRKT